MFHTAVSCSKDPSLHPPLYTDFLKSPTFLFFHRIFSGQKVKDDLVPFVLFWVVDSNKTKTYKTCPLSSSPSCFVSVSYILPGHLNGDLSDTIFICRQSHLVGVQTSGMTHSGNDIGKQTNISFHFFFTRVVQELQMFSLLHV